MIRFFSHTKFDESLPMIDIFTVFSSVIQVFFIFEPFFILNVSVIHSILESIVAGKVSDQLYTSFSCKWDENGVRKFAHRKNEAIIMIRRITFINKRIFHSDL